MILNPWLKKIIWVQCGDWRKIHWLKWDEMTKSKIVGGMGFRDLALFNDSLLAKQAWWLLKNTNSLFYKVFKTCFFPNCSILETKDSRSGSYAWKIILKGRDMILRGSRLQTGNGKSVKIWQNHWLTRKHPPLVSSPIIPSMEEATVDTLIETKTWQWNYAMIDGIFAP